MAAEWGAPSARVGVRSRLSAQVYNRPTIWPNIWDVTQSFLSYCERTQDKQIDGRPSVECVNQPSIRPGGGAPVPPKRGGSVQN